MIEANDASKVLEALAKNIAGVSLDKKNFEKLPDTFWGYFARGHDSKGKFGIIITYSESESDVDDLIAMYEDWISKHKSDNS
jgi:hypothetical protein